MGQGHKDGPGTWTGPSQPHCPTPVLLSGAVAVRKKRSISIPPDLDIQIERAAADAGVSYSAWLAATARKEFAVRSGLDAVASFERSHGAFSAEEVAEAERWAIDALERSRRSGARKRHSA
jgi:hypothetical protein